MLAALAASFDSLGVRWYLFGAQAAILHGVARLTADVDVTVRHTPHSIPTLIEAMETYGFVLRGTASDDFVARTSVLPLVHSATRLPVDVVLAGPGLEEQILDRAEPQTLDGVRVPVAAVEDLVTMKVLAGRPTDLNDVESMLRARQDEIDLDEVRRTLTLLEAALSRSDLLSRFEQIVQRVRRSAD
ncbi:MAG: hypothetical protein F4Y57_10435 [Acidobacteria bacterium]|nr:hypothetical protein [Acidobacteriota bacterium]